MGDLKTQTNKNKTTINMGCELSKLAGNSAAKGSDKNRNFDTNNSNVQINTQQQLDSRLPLTAKQKYSIIASWKGISRAMETTGINMFVK